eukprot:COSAG06_NODE_13880_length_1209_cov_9.426126_1_plen_127_part_00
MPAVADMSADAAMVPGVLRAAMGRETLVLSCIDTIHLDVRRLGAGGAAPALLSSIGNQIGAAVQHHQIVCFAMLGGSMVATGSFEGTVSSAQPAGLFAASDCLSEDASIEFGERTTDHALRCVSAG